MVKLWHTTDYGVWTFGTTLQDYTRYDDVTTLSGLVSFYADDFGGS